MPKSVLNYNNSLTPTPVNLEEPLFPIGSVALMLGIHSRTLRIYEACDLLTPSRSKRDRRLYSFNDISKCKLIIYLSQSIGLNIIGIKFVFHLLSMQKISESNYTNYIKETVKKLNITQEIQEKNREKSSKKGRKAKGAD